MARKLQFMLQSALGWSAALIKDQLIKDKTNEGDKIQNLAIVQTVLFCIQ